MRAIDADALLQRWNNLLPRMAIDKDGAVPIDFCLAIHEVSATPALTLDDLRPKGRWIDMRKSHKDVPSCKCSECGRVVIGLESKNNYCPSCGADMRGGGEDA